MLWGPRAGFGGLRTYFSRYLMSVGMPFELWMRRIAALSDAEISPAGFLNQAMNEVAAIPWLLGAKWQSPEGAGKFGNDSPHRAHFRFDQLEVTFFSETRLSPALLLHLRLLAQVIGEFYEGKRREQIQKQNAYLQAVHETGARLTHDIKNLLQSIYALTSAGSAQIERRTAGLEARAATPYETLLSRQLPELSKRLQTTLDRLRNPEIETVEALIPANEWWLQATERHAASGAQFVAEGRLSGTIPAALFDSVLENCLENARKKRVREPGIDIVVALKGDGKVSLSITDSGSAIPQSVVDHLFHAPIDHSSENTGDDAFADGMGIGLYQAARRAKGMGWAVEVTRNKTGLVQLLLEIPGRQN
jgi:signal transduction histidine kinase